MYPILIFDDDLGADVQGKERGSFLKKRTKKLFSGCRCSFRRDPTQRLKVFCFFSSEKKTFLA
jgi:hypothetical protein